MKHFVPALMIALALSGFNPGDALAASPAPTPAGSDAQTHPMVMQQAAAEVASAPTASLQPFRAAQRTAAVGGPAGLQREVFGFALLSSLADPTIGYPSWNFSLLSTVAVFGLHVNSGDGNLVADSGWNVWNSSQMTGLVNKAHATGTKVVVTIILQDFCVNNPARGCAAGNPTPQMCAGLTDQSRAHTVAQTAAQVAAKGVDGVNIDYESLQVTCLNGVNPRVGVTNLSRELRAALAPGSYLSVDTYSSSAGDTAGFFDVPGLNPFVDSFFVMAYDSDWSNYNHAPLNCSSYCLNPVSPLSGYFYNDTRAASEYNAALGGGGKVILGLPYYSRGACVSGSGPNLVPVAGTSTWTLSYRANVAMATDPSNSTYAFHRDANDGVTGWSTWMSNNTACRPMEMYWDDVGSLGQKYDLVNRAGLRGVGLWNLNLGGGSPELWSALSTYFSCPVTLNVPASPATTEFNVGLDAGGCAVSSFDVQQYDNTLGQGWYGMAKVAISGGTGTVAAEGYPGYSYQFRARAHSAAGVVSAWALATATVTPGAAFSHPFRGLYTLDGYGSMHAADSPPLNDSAYWAGWNIAKTAKALPGGPQSGFVLDGYGGLHSYGAPGPYETSGVAEHRWGWDIARDFAFLPDGSGGLVLDGYGGIHPFHVNGNAATIQVQGGPYWNWDIARKIVIFSDGKGGYVLDGYGGIHPFGINGPRPVAEASLVGGGYWAGHDIAHDITLVPGNGNHSGYVLDGLGGVHPFHPTSDSSAMPAAIQAPRWSWDIARSIQLLPGTTTAGYVMDGWGGIHPIGSAPAIANTAYWPGWDIAKVVWGA